MSAAMGGAMSDALMNALTPLSATVRPLARVWTRRLRPWWKFWAPRHSFVFTDTELDEQPVRLVRGGGRIVAQASLDWHIEQVMDVGAVRVYVEGEPFADVGLEVARKLAPGDTLHIEQLSFAVT